MTRDQAQRIANDIFDAAESAGHLSKDLVADAIFNSWHKQTASIRPSSYYVITEGHHLLASAIMSGTEWAGMTDLLKDR